MVSVKKSSSSSSPTSKQLSSLDKEDLQDKIAIVTRDFGSITVCGLILNDRTRLSSENALTVCDYIIAMKREINPSLLTMRNAIQILADISKIVGVSKRFEDYTREDILTFLDKGRKSEKADPMHKWIGTYNQRQILLSRFFKWLHYPDIVNTDERNRLARQDRKPDCIQGIVQLKRKEISCYQPSDLWTPEDDVLFLKYVTNPRDRCYHTMARDTSCRPHELLKLNIKDVKFNQRGVNKYAEVLVNGKTGSRTIPLIYSLPYVKAWLENHPCKNIPDSPLFVSFSKKSHGRNQLGINGAGRIYWYYQHEFFPQLLKEKNVSTEDKNKIKELLKKPWNPYIRRHTALTEKSTKLKAHVLNQHSGWSARSNMAQKYLHYYGNESSNDLLEAYGIVSKEDSTNDSSKNILKPIECPNCKEINQIDAKFCSKCRIALTYEVYQQTLDSEKQKETELKDIKSQLDSMQVQQSVLQKLFVEAINKLGQENKNVGVTIPAKELFNDMGLLNVPVTERHDVITNMITGGKDKKEKGNGLIDKVQPGTKIEFSYDFEDDKDKESVKKFTFTKNKNNNNTNEGQRKKKEEEEDN